MTDEEKLSRDEQLTARPRLKYEEGLKRIYVVLVACWVAFLLRIPVVAILQEGVRHRGLGLGAILQEGLRPVSLPGLLGLLVIPPTLGYAFFFGVIPWIIEGFRNTHEVATR